MHRPEARPWHEMAAPLLIRPTRLLKAALFMVGYELAGNSTLPRQGIDELGKDLVVEARAPDGVIEAFRVAHAANFALSVQWHPEWQSAGNPFSRALFAAFGEASRA